MAAILRCTGAKAVQAGGQHELCYRTATLGYCRPGAPAVEVKNGTDSVSGCRLHQFEEDTTGILGMDEVDA